MKTKEFDELIKQKFDRNDFAYNPENWDQLAEQLDGNAKKRSLIVWWWVPLAGMAASVALAFGISTVLRLEFPGNTGNGIAHVQTHNTVHANTAQLYPLSNIAGTANNETTGSDEGIDQHSLVASNTSNNKHKHTAARKRITADDNETDVNPTDWFAINLQNAIGNTTVKHHKSIDLLADNDDKPLTKKKQVEAINTFKPEEPKPEEAQKAPKLSVILSGGISHGSDNGGYVAGATIRKMVNDKVYVESDVAITSSSSAQSTLYAVQQTTMNHSEARTSNAARTTATTSETDKTQFVPTITDIILDKNVAYSLYYAQVTPSIGYKVIKRMSIGVGPDFQKMLADNRPAPSTVDRNNIQVAPSFDIGLVGKTEYALTKKVKAGVYYRKGVNNVITPMDKYIDRDYLQFQVKYTIFNK